MSSDDRGYETSYAFNPLQSLASTISLFIASCVNFGCSTWFLVKEYAKRRGLLEAIDEGVEKLHENPVLGVGLLFCAVICTLPLIGFLFVVGASIFAIFLALILVEGLFVSIAILIFVPCFIAVVMTMILAAVGLIVSYVSAVTVKQAVCDIQNTAGFPSVVEEKD